MSKKTKTFPLPLSSVMGRSSFEKPDYFGNRSRFDSVTVDGRPGKRKTDVPESKPVRFQGAGLNGPVASKTLRSMTERLARAGIADTVVLNAIGQIPRHLFVEPGLSGQAYEDVALPIGAHQTISKPSTIAKMLEALRAGSRQPCMKKILEIEWILNKAQTHAFTVLGMSQLVHAVGMRDVNRSVFRMKHFENLYMLAALGIGLLLQVLVTEVPYLITLFETNRLTLGEWGRLQVLSLTPLAVHELLCLFTAAGQKQVRAEEVH